MEQKMNKLGLQNKNLEIRKKIKPQNKNPDSMIQAKQSNCHTQEISTSKFFLITFGNGIQQD